MHWIKNDIHLFRWSQRALSSCKFLERSCIARRLQERKHGVCMFVFYKLFVTLRGRHAAFFRSDCSFRCTAQFSFLSLGGTTSFANLRLKISKSPKIGGKGCAHDFVQITERFEEYSTAVVQRRECRCALCDIFFRTSLYSADSIIVNVHIDSPKTDRNEHVCAHQKSYRK